MKRLLGDLAAGFDLEYRVRGVRLAELLENLELNLDGGPLQDFGTPGPSGKVASATEGPVDLHYVPHLFPEMDPKLRLAHRLQYALLPKGVPLAAPVSIAAVLESYCHLSGDLFGWEMLTGGDFLIWIVDMSGHGLETGLASALLKVIVDNLRGRDRVDELLGELNEALSSCVRPGGREMFATGLFMTLSADGKAKYCSAGHPPALVTGAKGQPRELVSNSRPVGLFRDQRFAVDETVLAPGETLFLYTDGLTELTTHTGGQFGLPRLREFLTGDVRPPREMTRSLYEDLARNHDMATLNDDVTFVAARMLEK
jgi:sigma-B regulation protein RsbU (phosphoserine phosphatase)